MNPVKDYDPSAPERGVCKVSPATDFIATLHEAVGSATSLYCVPLCPENFHPAPEMCPHRCPNAAGSPAPSAVVPAPATSTPTASITTRERGTFPHRLVLGTKSVLVWAPRAAKASEAVGLGLTERGASADAPEARTYVLVVTTVLCLPG